MLRCGTLEAAIRGGRACADRGPRALCGAGASSELTTLADAREKPGSWESEALRAWQARGAAGAIGAPMREHTTFRVGGPADLLLWPRDEGDVLFARRLAREMEVPLTVLGACSNVLVLDAGVRGMVLRTARTWEEVRIEGRMVTGSAGARMPLVAAAARRAGLGGLEFLAVIPGTVGGGLVQNAGAGGQCMADTFRSARVLDDGDEIRRLARGELAFGHRTSSLRGGSKVVLEVQFEGAPDDSDAIARRMREHRRRRRERLPLSKPCAGSIFRQVSGSKTPVGAIIERAGCKGWRSGDAVVSPQHANFIVNEGGATARDILELIGRVREAVRSAADVSLEMEICVIGNAE